MIVMASPYMFASPEIKQIVEEGYAAIQEVTPVSLPAITDDDIVYMGLEDESAEIMGIQVIRRLNEGQIWYYLMSYVPPKFRGQRVMDTVRKTVHTVASTDPDVKYLEYLIACDNVAMIKSVERHGIKPSNYHYRVEVTKVS